MDVVWDTYLHNSFKPGKNEVRVYRERWQTRPRSQAIGLTSAVTRQRSRKVRKAEKIVSTAFPAGKHVFAASGATVVRTVSEHSMPPCDHEEVHVDTIIVFHPPARCSREWMYHMPGDILLITDSDSLLIFNFLSVSFIQLILYQLLCFKLHVAYTCPAHINLKNCVFCQISGCYESCTQ